MRDGHSFVLALSANAVEGLGGDVTTEGTEVLRLATRRYSGQAGSLQGAFIADAKSMAGALCQAVPPGRTFHACLFG